MINSSAYIAEINHGAVLCPFTRVFAKRFFLDLDLSKPDTLRYVIAPLEHCVACYRL